MANIFPRWTNYVPLGLAIGVPVVLVALVGVVWYWFSPRYTDVGYQPEQPVPYSHRLHVHELGMDCRYCHNTVERSNYAALPPTATCMNCHARVKTDSPKLAPVRESFKTGEGIPWVKIHQLPDYAYFSHQAHIAAGVGCASCHGRVDLMDKVSMAEPLSMSWCLACHRNPKPNLRPYDQVTNMEWADSPAAATYDPDKDPARLGRRPLNPPVNCSGCHR